jgi:hypothetical protein
MECIGVLTHHLHGRGDQICMASCISGSLILVSTSGESILLPLGLYVGDF